MCLIEDISVANAFIASPASCDDVFYKNPPIENTSVEELFYILRAELFTTAHVGAYSG